MTPLLAINPLAVTVIVFFYLLALVCLAALARSASLGDRMIEDARRRGEIGVSKPATSEPRDGRHRAGL